MLILTQTNDTIKVRLGASATTQPQIFASYRAITSTTFVPQRNVINTNGTTDVNAVPNPSASTQHVVDFLSVYNRDNIAHTVTIVFDDNGTQYILFRGLIGVNEQVVYQEGKGFVVMAANGSQKLQQSFAAGPITSSRSIVVLGSNQVNNNAVANTLQDVTGLNFAVVTGNPYFFRFNLVYSAAATTTGCRFTLTGPATSVLAIHSRYSLTTTSETINYVNAYSLPAASNASSANTAGNIGIVEGRITPTVDGTVQLQFASEIANSAITVLAGSFVEYQII